METQNKSLEFNKQNTILSEKEICHLIMLARRDNPVLIDFGGKLLNVSENDWAFTEIDKLRCGDYSI